MAMQESTAGGARRGGRRRLALILGCALAASLGTPVADAGEPQRVKGTSVRIAPPDGWVSGERFPGFQHEESQSSIMVTILPTPSADLRKAFTKDALARKGMTFVAESSPQVNGAAAHLIQAEQTANGATYEKWLLIAGDDKSTVLIVGNVPKEADEKLRAAVKAAIVGATWDASAPADLFDALPFRLAPAGALTAIRAIGASVLLTEPDRPAAHAPRRPMYIAAVSHSPVPVDDAAAFSEARSRQTAGLKDVGNFRGSELKVAGLAAHELLADAKDKDTGTSMLLYQVLVPDGKGYWLIQGIVAAELTDEWLPVFRQITGSIEKKGAAAPKAPDGKDAPPAKPAPGSAPAPEPKKGG